MPNSSLPQDQDGQDLFNAISSFFTRFGVGKLLRKCNAQKEKGVPVLQIFKYKLCNVFADRSRIRRTGLRLFVQIRIFQKKKSFVSTEKDGRLKCFSRPAKHICGSSVSATACHMTR